MADFEWEKGTKTIIINDDAALTDTSRAAGDFDNTDNAEWCDVFLTVQFDTTAPSAGAYIGDLWVLPSDGEGSPDYPEGGDAGLGTDDDPQNIFLMGKFETINPSLSVDETLTIPRVPLNPNENRFVFKNTSGQPIVTGKRI
jgi:hypothetical protein